MVLVCSLIPFFIKMIYNKTIPMIFVLFLLLTLLPLSAKSEKYTFVLEFTDGDTPITGLKVLNLTWINSSGDAISETYSIETLDTHGRLVKDITTSYDFNDGPGNITILLDGELYRPNNQLSITPYAKNADLLDGYHSSNFILIGTKLGNTTQEIWAVVDNGTFAYLSSLDNYSTLLQLDNGTILRANNMTDIFNFVDNGTYLYIGDQRYNETSFVISTNTSMKNYVDSLKSGNTTQEIWSIIDNGTFLYIGDQRYNETLLINSVKDSIELNITYHEQNFKHGNTTQEIWIVINNGTYATILQLDNGTILRTNNLTDIFNYIDNGTYLYLSDQRYNETTFVISTNTSMKNYVDSLKFGNTTLEIWSVIDNNTFLYIGDQRYNETQFVIDTNTSMLNYVNSLKRGNTSEEVATMLDNATIARTNKDNDFGVFDLFGDTLGGISNWWNNLWVKNATMQKGNVTTELKLRESDVNTTSELDNRYLQTYEETDPLAYNGTLAFNSTFSFYYQILETITRFVNRSDWTTIDNYPSDCTNQYVYGISDTLKCSTPPDEEGGWINSSIQTNTTLEVIIQNNISISNCIKLNDSSWVNAPQICFNGTHEIRRLGSGGSPLVTIKYS